MDRRLEKAIALCLLFCSLASAVSLVETNEAQSVPRNHSVKKIPSISIVGDEFVIDGKNLRIISGSMHYFRLPAEYWRDRLRKLKAAGLNAVSTYIEWSFHEPEERQYNFEGDRNIAEFLRIAAEEGLYVLLRPGPYICAERDLGGLPYWLLGKYPNIVLRSRDPDFLTETRIWMNKLFSQIPNSLYGEGGPVILVQVENEYGSYGNDKQYMLQLRDIILEHVKSHAVLYTTDGSYPDMFRSGSVEGALTTIDFGAGAKVALYLKKLREYMPKGPLMNSEYYPGWLTHWTELSQHVPTYAVVKTLRDMLNINMNVNIYVFFGGTNFEYTAGANFVNHYQPDITSYDYDAPITEAGDLTEKYYALQSVIHEFFPDSKNISVKSPVKRAYGKVVLTPNTQLLGSEGRKSYGKLYNTYHGSNLPNFEQLRQRAGFILYETVLDNIENDQRAYTLRIAKPRDVVYIFIDGKLKGKLSRMHKIYENVLNVNNGSVLSLLVHSMGRINYGPKLHDNKGILSEVELDGKPVSGSWKITGFPLEKMIETPSSIAKSKDHSEGPILYEGVFNTTASKDVPDTFLQTEGWGKGYIWINGHNLGLYWPSVGPQKTLFVPGVWLRPTLNTVHLLELETPSPNNYIEFIDKPIII